MTGLSRNSRKWAALAAILVLAGVGVWQWGSYGPFEITLNTPGQTLDEIVVTLVHTQAFAHRSRSTYSQVRTGRSREPIHFPRGFVCLCLSRPTMTISAFHPAFFRILDTVPESAMRHFGVTRSTSNDLRSWADLAKLGDDELGERFGDWLVRLQKDYVPNAHLPIASVKPSMDAARRQLESLPVSEETKTRLRPDLDAIEARLRERAIQ